MGWFEDQIRRDNAIREARRQSNEEAVQSAFIRGFKPQLVKLVPGNPSAPVGDDVPISSHPPGVFKEAGTPESLTVYVGYDSRGVRRFRHEMLSEDVEPDTVDRLERALAKRDPARTLRVI